MHSKVDNEPSPKKSEVCSKSFWLYSLFLFSLVSDISIHGRYCSVANLFRRSSEGRARVLCVCVCSLALVFAPIERMIEFRSIELMALTPIIIIIGLSNRSVCSD